MGLEFTVSKELATLSVTLSELAAIVDTVTQHIRSGEFCDNFHHVMSTLNFCYQTLPDHFSPWLTLKTYPEFNAHFDNLHEAFKNNFLKAASQPRPHVERAYEDYQTLRQFPEFKTQYPLLRRNYIRLNEFIDKWIDNDTFLMMTFDRAFKMLNRLLQEVSDTKTKDDEDAFAIFQSAFLCFEPYLQLIATNYEYLSDKLKRQN